jgi:AraC-like DNA-binding protein
MIFRGPSKEYLQLESRCNAEIFANRNDGTSLLSFLWIRNTPATLRIDGQWHSFEPHQVLCLTEFHQVEAGELHDAYLLRFNRAFYCILDHDHEVGCKGVLFFGAKQLPIFRIPDIALEQFEIVWKMFALEMESADALQQEMLQAMLKRFIILCMRIYKQIERFEIVPDSQMQLVRDFNFLVEQHFRKKHSVAEYAQMLHKSPKTLSNLFSKVIGKSPQQFIQERRILEAKRLLLYSLKPVKEIAYELGFEDIQTFSRFFKKIEKISPSDFKNTTLGNIANK